MIIFFNWKFIWRLQLIWYFTFYCVTTYTYYTDISNWASVLRETLGKAKKPAWRSTINPEVSRTGHWDGERRKRSQVLILITLVQKYHNQSNIVLGGKNEEEDEEEKKRQELEKKKKEEELNKKLP